MLMTKLQICSLEQIEYIDSDVFILPLSKESKMLPVINLQSSAQTQRVLTL